jgi:polyribonucleotide nucleotidyltransferase
VDDLAQRYKEGDEIEVVVLEQNGRKIELATPEYLA